MGSKKYGTEKSTTVSLAADNVEDGMEDSNGRCMDVRYIYIFTMNIVIAFVSV